MDFIKLNEETAKQLVNWEYYLVLFKGEKYPLVAQYIFAHFDDEDVNCFDCYPFSKTEIWQVNIKKPDCKITHFMRLPTSMEILNGKCQDCPYAYKYYDNKSSQPHYEPAPTKICDDCKEKSKNT